MTDVDVSSVVPLLPLTREDRQTVLAAKQAEIRACRRCVVAGFIPEANPVLRGRVEQRLMIVGQAPGALGHEHPVPYMGATGKTLGAWLERAGFPPGALHERFYLTSLTKCFPGPGVSGKGDRAPSPAEIRLCGGHLDAEIALLRPEAIVSLGRLAATALVGDAPLDRLVGTARPAERAGHAFLVLPLPHPSGVSHWLNGAENKARLAAALALLDGLRVERGW